MELTGKIYFSESTYPGELTPLDCEEIIESFDLRLILHYPFINGISLHIPSGKTVPWLDGSFTNCRLEILKS